MFEQDIQRCIETLNQGGVILFATDTIWGLGCDATNEVAVQKVLAIKQRQAAQGLIVLVHNASAISHYVAANNPLIFEYLRTCTKPTTVIYEGAKNLAKSLVPPDGTVAIRIANDAFCEQLISQFGKPIVSTSANIHGMPTARFFNEIDSNIINAVDYVANHRQNDMESRQASSLVKVHPNGEVQIIRP
jgi:L-threonylcarbamoyladenylate synthase